MYLEVTKGMSYDAMEDEGIMLPVVHSEIDYKQPLFMTRKF